MLDRAELARHDINYEAGMDRFMGKEALFERFLLKFFLYCRSGTLCKKNFLL